MEKKNRILIIIAVVAAVLLYATYIFIEGRLDAGKVREKQAAEKNTAA